MALICGIHLGEVVAIAADRPASSGAVGAYQFGAIAGVGSAGHLAGFNRYLEDNHTRIQTLENVVGHIEAYKRTAAGACSPQDHATTGWLFGALHAFDGSTYSPALGIYHPALAGGPAMALQQGAIELLGLSELSLDERREFTEKWQGIYRSAFDSGGLAQLKGFLGLLFEDAAIISKAVAPAFDVAITNGQLSDFL